ncbi:hypothetical protein RTCIAT899_PC04530 (plasmid) [Rhizobium tropici CIAT 899]|nr:hypothetical protein RTCIAT899_PC04530 [Rhizobium tropici CIAT 899]
MGPSGHPPEQCNQSICVVIGFKREQVLVRELTNRKNDLAFRPSRHDRSAHQFSISGLKRVLAANVPIRVIIGHEWSCDIWHGRKVN